MCLRQAARSESSFLSPLQINQSPARPTHLFHSLRPIWVMKDIYHPGKFLPPPNYLNSLSTFACCLKAWCSAGPEQAAVNHLRGTNIKQFHKFSAGFRGSSWSISVSGKQGEQTFVTLHKNEVGSSFYLTFLWMWLNIDQYHEIFIL